MNSAARPWIALFFKCAAALALIFAFVFFMRMQEEQSVVDRYRAEGTVSRAIITDKQVDTVRYEGRRGRSRTEEWRMLWIRFDPDSTVKYADYPASVSEAQLPGPDALSGDPVADNQGVEIITVPPAVYDAAQVGDSLVVVDTFYSSDGPLFHAEIRDFDPASFYPGIGISLALMVVLGLIGWRIGRRRAA
ncbi:hypothetical protein [Alteraurantiacibacter buctensis]|uniref:Uncharacterized protein n=1 Tax=Alteraurantiacibacter buctensis TaxID=1503981 RepID=A0A844Z0Q3_9SPHN|nr:hypothetical protein [Alteraurantiacibacter buctensis]MXO71967.1 hypothetical protein [Alteraurantiacibacter buctensis]